MKNFGKFQLQRVGTVDLLNKLYKKQLIKTC